MTRRRAGLGLAPRLLLSFALVILAGSGTVVVAAVLVGPSVFSLHLMNAGVAVDDLVLHHVTEAFGQAVLAALATGIAAAAVTALGISWFVARRLAAPIRDAAVAAKELAGGRLGTRMDDPRMGPELATLATAVNDLAHRLQTTESARRQLTAELAHQLRTPIASVEATLEAVREGILPLDEETLETLTSQSARLRRLVADLEVVSRAQERQLLLATESVPVGQLVESAVASSAEGFRAAGVTLTATTEPGTPAVAGDDDRLHEVLGALLDNALRHTPAGGSVSVSVGPGRFGTFNRAAVMIKVEDSGRGFAPEEADAIFQRFHKSSDSPGSGLGLTIARALVEAHGGTLVAASDGQGKGATFTVTLPATATLPSHG
jgi:two-component system, OmpR family, sensor histidine kinase BaeS